MTVKYFKSRDDSQYLRISEDLLIHMEGSDLLHQGLLNVLITYCDGVIRIIAGDGR